MNKLKRESSKGTPVSKPPHTQSGLFASRGTRETVESIVIAVILAFLFRAFEAEAFVIPTGSMAPTLMGRHMDVACEQCGYRYQTGASSENDEGGGPTGEVIKSTCPICRRTMLLDKDNQPNERSFTGDRILVSKFAYDVSELKRWDVIVFKFPGNAKQNYIKRLVGLPNEKIKIRHGDIYYQKRADLENDQTGFYIARKPPDKVEAMLQLVDDTDYVGERLLAAKWPSRWQQWSLAGSDVQADWQHKTDGFETAGTTADPAWLRYRHLIPSEGDWENILNRWGEIQQGTWSVGPDASRGQLITDYYAYNDGIERSIKLNDPLGLKALGMHWVGDLAVECQVEVKSNQGELLLELVEGGTRYECRINVADGSARFSIDGGRQTFVGDDGTTADHPSAATKIRGGGSYQLRFSNVDDQLLLWIDNRPISFNGPTTYVAPDNVRPYWTPADPGDLEPAGVGSRGAALLVSRLRILRDVYYIATNIQYQDNDYDGPFSATQIQEVLTDPGSWSTAPLFDVGVRRTVDFEMGDDQFFPLGDNSPQSRDARLWSSKEENPDAPDPYVPRKLLTGKALLIYWPHHWRWPTPFLPNFKRMGLIR